MQSSDLEDIPAKVLVGIFNSITGKSLSSFNCRAVAVKRTLAAIDKAQLDGKRWAGQVVDMGEYLSSYLPSEDKTDRRFDRLTIRQKMVMSAIYRISKIAMAESVDRFTLAKQLETDNTQLNYILGALAGKNIIAKLPDGSVTLFESAREWIIPIERELKSRPSMRIKDFHRSGPSSQYTGKWIKKWNKSNPYKINISAWHSWNIMEDGMFYEDYMLRGGKWSDLSRAVKQKRITMKD